jgi:Hypothetical protein (DUF2513)
MPPGVRIQRDWDLIRAILTQASEQQPGMMLDGTQVQGCDHFLVNAHIAMLHDAGYLHAAMIRGRAIVTSATVKDVTMKGYDLLDTIKSQTVWARIKKLAKDEGIELSFDAVKQLAGVALKQVLGSDGS